jgi:ceramide glucosyltransferase
MHCARMSDPEFSIAQAIALVPVFGGLVYGVLNLCALLLFARRRPIRRESAELVPVTILKPICGLEKELEANIRSCCEQDYPNYQVVLSVQRADDPALPLLRSLATEYGAERVTLAQSTADPLANGKIHNLLGAIEVARHELLVLSDSDVRVRPDYLRVITAPLSDPQVGYVCTPYRAVAARSWYERLEQLSLHDFTVNIGFAWMTGASDFCLGASVAFRRGDLDRIGGLEPLGDYLVEDFEMGRRLQALGLRLELLPYFVDTTVDLASALAWWRHQLYWDQNTWAARPIGFLATILVRSLPFALIFAALRLFDPLGVSLLAGVATFRLATAAAIMRSQRDREGLRNLLWLPLRDLAGLGTWLAVLPSRSVTWRGGDYGLTGDGRMVQDERTPEARAADRALSD